MVIPRSPKLCARSWVDRRATSRLLAAALAVVAAGGAGAAHAQAAHADTPSSSQYGEVARFGGFDSAAFTGSDNPSGLSAGKFVLPVGFAVDSNDSSMPDDYGIYVLDVTNPAAIHNNGTIDYRLQKLDDRGNVFATTTFQMATPQNGGYQAQYLAIDDTNHRVYTALTQRTLNRVLAWSTVPTGSGSDATLPAASGLPADDVVTNAAQLVGPTALGSLGLPHGTSMNNFAGLAVTQGTDGADVDVQGSPSNSGGGDVGIARFHADGANTGTLDGTWENTTMAEGNSLSTAPDGSLVSVAKEFVLDASNTGDPGADVTRFDSALTPTTYEPSADEVAAHQANFQSFNYYTEPVIAASRPDNWGLAGDGVELSNGDFAGTKVVQYWNAAYPWLTPGFMEQINFNLVTGDPQYTPGDLGIQISDARGRPVGMIGSDQSGATCDIQGGGNYYAQMALAPGRDGTVFALSQADLTTTDSGKLGDDSTFTPSVPFGQGGDQVIEFAPGAGQACPPPSPMVLVNGQDADTTTVNVNDEVDLDISTSDLQGEAPTEIDGDLDGSGRYATVDAMSGDNGWSWPSAIQSTSFDTAGRYTIGARAHTVDGVFQTTRTIVVNDPGAPVARIAANGSGFKAGDTVTFTADGSSGGGDNSVADYNWDFNDGSDPDDTDAPTDTHTFTQPGDYTATLRVISSASPPRTATATVSVHVDPADTNTGGGGDQNNGGGGDQNNQGGGQTTTQVTPPPATTSTTPPPPARLSNTPPAPKVATPSAKVSSGKIAVGFKPSAAGTVTIRLTAKVGKRTVVIGTAHATVKAGKVVSLKVTPTKAGRRALAKKTKVTMTITLKPKSGKSVTVTKTASLKFAVAAKPKAEHKK